MAVPTLTEGQYDLDGYKFGTLADEVVLLESGVDWGQTGMRTQDVEEPLGDGVIFGRDFLAPPSWTFTLGARHPTDVNPVVARLAAAWRADAIRGVPNARSTLHYRQGGITKVVYGRPRRFAVETPKVWNNDFRIITCDFQLASAIVMVAATNSLTLSLVRTSTATGLMFPVRFAATFGSSTDSRSGYVTVGGSTPTPFVLRINGPSSGSATAFRVESVGGTDPWALDVPVSLTSGQYVEIDTSTGVVLMNGSPASLQLGRDTNLAARLSPGTQEIVFTANDPSQSAAAVLTWRDAAASAT